MPLRAIRFLSSRVSILMAAIPWIVVGHAQAAVIQATSASFSNVAAAIALAANGDTINVPANIPTRGTWTLSFDGSTALRLARGIDATALQVALNALSSVTTAGGVTVTGSIKDGFVVAFNVNGARNLITGNVSGLSPVVDVVIGRQKTGNGATKEEQTIRIGNDWTTTLLVTKSITLIGQTTVTGPMSNPTVNNQTIILDDETGTGGNVALLKMQPPGFFRISGFTFRAGSPTRAEQSTGAIQAMYSHAPTFRIDHCVFDRIRNANIGAMTERGVIDHNVAYLFSYFVSFHPYNWGGGSYWGDKSWSEPLNLGSDRAVFVEDNYIKNSITGIRSTTDAQTGARFVLRHNTLIDTYTDTHGTESGGRFRAPRSWEIYQNTFTLAAGKSHSMVCDFRGGTGVIWDNTVTGAYNTMANFANYRDFYYNSVWGGDDGLNAWDLNDTSDRTGNGFGGGAGGIYASGTHTGGNGARTLTVAGAGWTTNQWVRYALRNPSNNQFSTITSNTSDTITYGSNPFGPMMTFNNGQSFEIRKVIQSLDHCGSGQSDLLVGDTPTPHWLNQIIEPAYCWGNTINGAPGIGRSSSNIVEGRDFFNGTSRPGYVPYTYPHPLVSGGGEQGYTHSTAAQSAWKRKLGSKSQTPKVTAKHLPVKTGKKAQTKKRQRDVSLASPMAR